MLVTPPWNFPIAIPAGGLLAALMAGNTVLLKPAPETVLVAWELVQAFWDAGIPHDVLQFTPTTDDEVGRALVTDDRVDAVILTGGYETSAPLFKLEARAASAGRNQRQKQPDHFRSGRPRPGHQRSGLFGFWPQRAKMFGGQPGRAGGGSI
ncbi:MAG: aldehyde dehydrogenase family protein [Caldilineaceae bacterium]